MRNQRQKDCPEIQFSLSLVHFTSQDHRHPFLGRRHLLIYLYDPSYHTPHSAFFFSALPHLPGITVYLCVCVRVGGFAVLCY